MNNNMIKPKAGDGVNYVTAEGATVPSVVERRSAFPSRTDTGSPCDLRLADGARVSGVRHDAAGGPESWHLPAPAAEPKKKTKTPPPDAAEK